MLQNWSQPLSRDLRRLQSFLFCSTLSPYSSACGQDINLKPICGGSPGSALPMPKYGQVFVVTKSAI